MRKFFIIALIFGVVVLPTESTYYCKQQLGCSYDQYGSYPTLQDAKLACDSDISCAGVYDHYCDDKDFSLCPIDANTYASTSCIYLKYDDPTTTTTSNLTTITTTPGCQFPWSQPDPKSPCYAVSEKEMDYFQARKFCLGLGGMLAEPRSFEQKYYIEQFIKKNNLGYWIGLHDLCIKDTWTWDSDSREVEPGLDFFHPRIGSGDCVGCSKTLATAHQLQCATAQGCEDTHWQWMPIIALCQKSP